MMNTRPPSVSGIQPPSNIFRRFAEKKARSTANRIGTSKPGGQGNRKRHHAPIDEWYVDLSVFFCGSLTDPHSWKPAKLHGLPRHGERTGNDGLAGDDGGEGCKRNQRINRPVGRQFEKWVCLQVGSF